MRDEEEEGPLPVLLLLLFYYWGPKYFILLTIPGVEMWFIEERVDYGIWRVIIDYVCYYSCSSLCFFAAFITRSFSVSSSFLLIFCPLKAPLVTLDIWLSPFRTISHRSDRGERSFERERLRQVPRSERPIVRIRVGNGASRVVERRVQAMRVPLRQSIFTEVREETNLPTRWLARHPPILSHTGRAIELFRHLAIVGPQDGLILSDGSSGDENSKELSRSSRKRHELLSQLGVHMDGARWRIGVSPERDNAAMRQPEALEETALLSWKMPSQSALSPNRTISRAL